MAAQDIVERRSEGWGREEERGEEEGEKKGEEAYSLKQGRGELGPWSLEGLG